MNFFHLNVKPAKETKVFISVPKNIFKKAVIRNLIKRRIRSIIKKISPNLKPANYFINVRAGAERLKSRELEEKIITLLSHQASRK